MKATDPKRLITIYGDLKITEPVILDLINCEAVQRLKEINQFGIKKYASIPLLDYTRYDHSIGVLSLLQKYNASIDEQIAGLLHDVSHTVFSHVGDVLFDITSQENSYQSNIDYQDSIHEWYLKQTDIPKILKKYNKIIDDIHHKSKSFLLLERDLPELCADRIEYILYEGWISRVLSTSDLKLILNNLDFVGKDWVFKDLNSAKKFADLSLFFTKNNWSSDWGGFIYIMGAKALKRSLALGIITEWDVHFSTDDVVWETMNNSDDEILQALLESICNSKHAYKLASSKKYDLHIKGKFRGVNPWVLDVSSKPKTNRYKRLTELDSEYCNSFNDIKTWVSKGHYYSLTS